MPPKWLPASYCTNTAQYSSFILLCSANSVRKNCFDAKVCSYVFEILKQVHQPGKWCYSASLASHPQPVRFTEPAMLSSSSNWQMGNTAKHFQPRDQNCDAGSPWAHLHWGCPPTSAQGGGTKMPNGCRWWMLLSPPLENVISPARRSQNTPTGKLFRSPSDSFTLNNNLPYIILV